MNLLCKMKALSLALTFNLLSEESPSPVQKECSNIRLAAVAAAANALGMKRPRAQQGAEFFPPPANGKQHALEKSDGTLPTATKSSRQFSSVANAVKN